MLEEYGISFPYEKRNYNTIVWFFLNGGKDDALVCGQSGPPGWPTLCSRGPLCVHHAYLECITPASLAFCRNIMYFD